MNIIDSVNAKISVILKKAGEERAAAQEALDAANAKASAAAKDREAAIQASDLEAFHAAKAAETMAADEAELYRGKIALLTGKRLISAQENEETVSEIRTAQESLRDECAKKIMAHIMEIEKIGKQYYEDQDALNKLLFEWHRKIYTQPHPRRKNCDADVWELKFDDGEVRHHIFKIVTNNIYRKFRGLSPYSGNGSIWT